MISVPGQVEAPEWMSEYAADKNGYVTRVFAFRLTEGTPYRAPYGLPGTPLLCGA